ncbi:MAG: zinc-dependent metalloprotease [Candidatus Marinimicrobia bacterium]|nr:zinc-dependent metalloprotease [Candidatus Neomarinimicrobiota bacterium]
MKKFVLCLVLLGFVFAESISDKTKSMQKMDGYFNLYWDNNSGKLWLEISDFNQEFLYVNSLTAGMGSNDVGLDRGQLGNERIVYFHRVGPKVLLIQPNYHYRANTDDPKEKQSVADGFAKSTLWGFKVEAEEKGSVLVDATDFFLDDVHGIVSRLNNRKMGNYKVDKSRSAIHLPDTKNFPRNTEVEALMTYTGSNPGRYVRQVTPTPNAITVRLHHSFVTLPDDNYTPRKHDPRAGYFPMSFQDYAMPLDESIYIRYITRHRLEKKNPRARRSEVKEPIIYYIDPGVPEPVKTAMLESGRWWNQAFNAAGFNNAFQVKVLPDGAHPLDVRYNMIHWVHRATRGWSYGSAVVDPRTGEIIKGNVSLGSLRLRQDYLIATGLLAPYDDGVEVPGYMRELALARVRQLVAHEIGHTIGLAHNYIASTAGRASVMDYPHPTVTLDKKGNVEWRDAYDVGIGEWDKITVAYGYQDFPKGSNEKEALEEIIQDGIRRGYTFITDQDARPLGSAHPTAHLWDNGKDPVSELKNLMAVRKTALNNFGENNIRMGQPYSDIEDVLVPIYFLHRYQIQGAAKVVGGLNFTYALRGDGQLVTEFLDPKFQMEALDGLIGTLQPDALTLREELLQLIPPRASGRGRTRESFNSRTSVTFDGVSLAETAANLTCRMIFHPARATRLVEYNARNTKQPGLEKVLNEIIKETILQSAPTGLGGEIKRNVDFIILDHLMSLTINKNASPAAQSIAMAQVNSLSLKLFRNRGKSSRDKAHFSMLQHRIKTFLDEPEKFEPIKVPNAPPGSPIGTEFGCTFENPFNNNSK